MSAPCAPHPAALHTCQHQVHHPEVAEVVGDVAVPVAAWRRAVDALAPGPA